MPSEAVLVIRELSKRKLESELDEPRRSSASSSTVNSPLRPNTAPPHHPKALAAKHSRSRYGSIGSSNNRQEGDGNEHMGNARALHHDAVTEGEEADVEETPPESDSLSRVSSHSHLTTASSSIGNRPPLAVPTPDDVDRSEYLWYDIHLDVEPGDTIVIQGPSGVGKTTLLRAVAQLTDYDAGSLYLCHHTPQSLGIPVWRSRVMYVPQQPAILPGSPLDFFFKVKQFQSHWGKEQWDDPVEIGARWGLNEEYWCAEWRSLSGGQAQRAALAIAVATRPDVLLLDEPTSALDPQACRLVEATLCNYTCLWVTHDPRQARRMATKILELKSDATFAIHHNTPASNAEDTSSFDQYDL